MCCLGGTVYLYGAGVFAELVLDEETWKIFCLSGSGENENGRAYSEGTE